MIDWIKNKLAPRLIERRKVTCSVERTPLRRASDWPTIRPVTEDDLKVREYERSIYRQIGCQGASCRQGRAECKDGCGRPDAEMACGGE